MVDGRTVRSEFYVDESTGMSPGFMAVPTSSQPSIVKAIRVYSSSCCKRGDPTKYILEGRNNDGSEWTFISQGPLAMGGDRNKNGEKIKSTFDAPDQTKTSVEDKFENEVAYTQYRIFFPNDVDGERMTVGEVELPGIVF